MSDGKRYRVIQWATGNIGARSLAAILEHPKLELVGVLVNSEAKSGKDAGELCGLGRTTGIKATCSVDDIVAMDADAVVYMPIHTNIDHVARLLASGKNIATPAGSIWHPKAMEAKDRAQLEAACQKGGTSIYASGSSPGFISETVTLSLLGMQRRFDSITIHEFADISSRDSRHMIFDIMGFGTAPGERSNAEMAASVHNDVLGTFYVLEDALGIKFDEVKTVAATALARKNKAVAAGDLKAGTVAAMRYQTSGIYKGRPLVVINHVWYLSSDIEEKEAWHIEDKFMGWIVKVRGDTSMDSRITFDVAPEDLAAYTPGLTGHRVVNAVPLVCEAPPGFRSEANLGHVLPAL